jgi:hypothetical protein
MGNIDIWTGRVNLIVGEYTISQRDRFSYINPGISNIAITLPAACLVRGFPFIFFYTGALAGIATVTAAGSDTIITNAGIVTSFALAATNDNVLIYSDGLYWHVMREAIA